MRNVSHFGLVVSGFLIASSVSIGCAQGDESTSSVNETTTDRHLSPEQVQVDVPVIDLPGQEPCRGPSDETPWACREYRNSCGWGGKLTLIMDLLSQATPGCFQMSDSWFGWASDAAGMCTEVLSYNDREWYESIASAACSIIACIPRTGPSERLILPLRLACAGGNIGAFLMRCTALAADCDNSRELLRPHCPTDNPCIVDLKNAGGGCDANRDPKDPVDITRECSEVVGRLNVTGAVNSSCMRDCVGGAYDKSLTCGLRNDVCGGDRAPESAAAAVF